MALELNKDPYTYAKDYEGFIQDLKQFHTNRGTPFSKLPQLSGRDIDLYLLYRRVIALGGWQKVNEECHWEDIQEEFRIPRACTNGSTALKFIYIRYLDLYEKVRFLGEDPKYEKNEYEGEAAARKKSNSLLHRVPLHYNHNQHNVAGYMRQNVGMSCQMYEASDYLKLEKAFLCGLPNEVDFAMNVCLLLSNEGKHIMKLSKSKHLLELMLANVGIFSTGMSSLQTLSEDGWSVSTGRDYVTFWYDTVDDAEVRNLILPFEILTTPKEIVGGDVFNLKREIGINDVEGQRILQMAVILRNLSFEADNCNLMSADPLVFRFLILCSHSKYGCLKQIGLDTLGNLASKFILNADNCDMTEIMLKTISKCLVSADKFEVVRGLEILSKLCQVEKNEEVVSDKLGQKCYEDIVQLLTIHDIQLIVYTLEALYQLSEIGEATTTKIACVKHAVDVLVSLTTVEAQSYGPNSLVGIKVVEYVPPPQAPEALPGSSGPPSSSHTTHTATPSTPRQAINHTPVRQQALQNQSIPTDSDLFACNWLTANYEYKEGCLSQVSIFSDYLAFCGRIPIRDVVNSKTFIECLRNVFPKAEKVTSDKNGKAEVNVKGLVKRALPLPVTIPPQVVASSSQNSPRRSQKAPVNKSRVLTMNSTLRQRLSEPPKMPIQGSPYISYPGIGQHQGNSATPAMPPASPSSTTYPMTQGSPQMSPSGTPYGTPQHSPNRPMTILQKQLQSPPQNSPAYKKGKKQVKTKFPSINKALQGEPAEMNSPVKHNGSPNKPSENIVDSNQGATPKKSADSNMIKTLLAKKLNENISKQNAAAALQVGEKPVLPPSYQQSWHQNPSNYAPVHQQSIPHSHSTIVNQQLQQRVEGQPIQGATTVQNESHPPNPLLASPESDSIQLHQSRQPVIVDPAQQQQHPLPSIHNPAMNSPKTEPSPHPTSSINSQSPYFQSTNSIETNQPLTSQTPGKLKQPEVCREVETVQNIVPVTLETKIEHVENKSVLIADSKLSDSIVQPESKEIPSSEQNDLKPPCVNSSDKAVHLSETLPIIVNNVEEPMEVEPTIYKTEQGNNNKMSGKVISSRTSPVHMVNGCLDESSKDSDLSFMNSPLPHTDDTVHNDKLEFTHVSQKENHSLPNGVSNGPVSLESKDNSMDSFTKEEILLRNSSVEKAAKLIQNRNGLVNHLGNGDCYSKDTAVDQKSTECSRDKVHIEDSCDSFSSATGAYRADSISTGAEDCQKSVDLHGDLHRDLISPPAIREETKHLPVNGLQVNGLSEGDSNCSSDKIMVNDTIQKESSITSKQEASQSRSQPEKPQVNSTDSNHTSAMEIDSPTKPLGAVNGHSEASFDSSFSLASGPVQCVIDSLEAVSNDQLTPKQKSKHSKSKAGSTDKNSSKKAKTSEKKPKSRKRSRSNTSQGESQSSFSSTTGADLLCEWNGCKKMFEMPKAVFSHAYLTHLTRPNDGLCKWEGCDKLQRKKWSLVTHVQDHHCSEQALRLAAQRRQQAAQMASPTAQQSAAAPATGQSAPLVYPNDAAIQAIRRFSARPPFQELVEPREGPVTKHIRLTASLVLRNLARYSAVGRSLIKHHENQLSYSALSAVESSSALANCLWAALHDH